MQRERNGMGGPLLASALLHGGALLIGLIAWPWLNKPLQMGQVVPVTIVSTGPVTNVRPAVEAPEEVEALTEEPVPEETPEPVAPPAPEPDPAPSKPTPKADAPSPKPKPAAKRSEEPSLDLDALAQSLEKKAAGKPRSGARKGPSRAETATEARPAIGEAHALTANALSSLAADLERRWNPNCAVEGGSDVDIRAAFRLTSAGRVVGGSRGVEVTSSDLSDPLVAAAADRARRAVVEAQPFEGLPPGLYGQRIAVTFNARKACAR